MHGTPSRLLLTLSIYAAILFAFAGPIVSLRAQSGSAPGGFLESATSLTTRTRPTAAQIAGFLPARGVFTFPAPYNTQGIRLTNGTDCPGNDCVLPVGYSYWKRINNHVGSDTLLAVLTLDKNLGGSGPTLFSYNKVAGVTTKVGPLFAASDPLSWAHGEMFYFSATRPTAYYIHDGPRLMRYDVLARTTELVVDITAQFGADKYIWQPHSSNDDTVHSFTVRRNGDWAMLGCAVYNERTRAFNWFAATTEFDECQIDKSGRFLVIKEQVDGTQGEDNVIQDLATGVQRLLVDPAGAGGHSDDGFGYMVAEDNYNAKPGAVRLWRLDLDPADPANGKLVFQATDWNWGTNHIAHSNAVAGVAPEQQMVCSSEASRYVMPRSNEVLCYKLDGSLQVLVVAPVMTNLDAAGGRDDYYKAPKGNLDVTGEYFIWTSNMGTSRMDAFIVRVPKQLLGLSGSTPPPSAPPAPPPPDGNYTLSIARPAGGTILGPEIYCGDGGTACAITKPAGTTVDLLALPTGANVLVSWGGCAPSFTLNSNLSCAPAFGGSAPPPSAPPSGMMTLTIARPSGGTILGPEIFCGDGGAACSVTKSAGTAIELLALPTGANILTSWGGCAASFALNSDLSCAPAFGGAAPSAVPPAGGGGSGAAVLTIARVPGGTILGPSLFCGDMGGSCQVVLASGTYVELAALASAGNTFTGWESCASAFVIDSDMTCVPVYNGIALPPPASPSGPFTLSLVNPGTGGGGGFILGPEMVCEPGNVGTCSVSYSSPATVTLTPVPYAGFSFGGWVEAGCANVMTISGLIRCTANFNRN